MKALLCTFLVACAALFSTPAAAQSFAGPRIEVTAGADDLTQLRDRSDVNYGAALGYDLAVSERLRLGVEVNSDNAFERDRVLGASARLGYVVSPRVLVYGTAGYENYRLVRNRDLEGFRVGGGLEVALSRQAFVKAEYRYSDLEANTGRHSGLVGIGLRL